MNTNGASVPDDEPLEQGGERDGEGEREGGFLADHEALTGLLRSAHNELNAPRGAPPPRTLAKKLIESLQKITDSGRGRSAPLSPSDIIREMREHGPLVHEPTGFPSIDGSTMGGPVYGSRWYVLGAPDASKTALLAQLAHEYAGRGITVGMMASDEEGPDILTRLAQRVGFTRYACEAREDGALDTMDRLLGGLPLRIYPPDWTIDRAARDLGRIEGKRCLIIDSIQTVKCDAELTAERELSEVQAIGKRVAALREGATAGRLIAIATSEMSRGAYKAIKRADRINPMAAGKWSGAIEYSARVMLSLECVKTDEETDVVQVEIIKNKHGRRRYADRDDAIYLSLHKPTQTTKETDRPTADDDDDDGDGHAHARRGRRSDPVRDAAAAAVALVRDPGMTSRRIRAVLAMSSDRTERAMAVLGSAVVVVGGSRGAQLHYLNGGEIPDEVLREVQSEYRNAVITARPPSRAEGDDDAS